MQETASRAEAETTCHGLRFTVHGSYSLNDVRRRSALDEGERDDATARPLDLLAPVYLFGRVVAALREHVRQDFADESARRLFVEDRHEIHGRECGEKFRALALAHHGPSRALQ